MTVARIAGAMGLLFSFCTAGVAADDIRLDLPTLPGFQRHVNFLAQPGFLAIALENNDLSPSQASKLKVMDQGRAAEIRNATLRFLEKKGQVYTYEAAYLLGVRDMKLSFPVSVDLSELAAGKTKIVLSPPMAALIPSELVEKIRIKSGVIANEAAQRKLLAYLDQVAKEPDPVRAILIDAYNHSAAPIAADARQDVGDALPLSEQWMLLLTILIWLVAVPAAWFYRRRRAAPASR